MHYLYVIFVWSSFLLERIQKDLADHQDTQTLDSSDVNPDNPEEKVKVLNEVVFAILSSLQQEMLTYNLDKTMIRSLVKKICSSMTSFPELYLQQMLKKIDEYEQLKFFTEVGGAAVSQTANSSVVQAKQFLTEPQKDPLYKENDRQEEHKKLASQYTAPHY